MKTVKTFEAFIGDGHEDDYGQEFLELVQLMIDHPEDIELTGGEDEQSPTPDNFINFEFGGDNYTLAKDHKSLSFGYSEESGNIAYTMPSRLFKLLKNTIENLNKRTDVENDFDIDKFNAQPNKRLNRYKDKKRL